MEKAQDTVRRPGISSHWQHELARVIDLSVLFVLIWAMKMGWL